MTHEDKISDEHANEAIRRQRELGNMGLEEAKRRELSSVIANQIGELSFIEYYQEQGEVSLRNGPKRIPSEVKHVPKNIYDSLDHSIYANTKNRNIK